MATWRELIKELAKEDLIIKNTLSETELDVEFHDGHVGTESKAFTAWREKYVYFPVCYDGAEWVGRARRNPCDEATKHMGGG